MPSRKAAIASDHPDPRPAVGEITGLVPFSLNEDLEPERVPEDRLWEEYDVTSRLYPLDEEYRVLTAAARGRRKAAPQLYANPNQHLDYRIYEGLMKMGPVGAMADAFVKFLMGQGFKPELELINPDREDEERNRKEIEANQEIIDCMLAIDRHVERNMPGEQDVTFRQKIAALIASTLFFNRGALMFGGSGKGHFAWNGKAYPEIPGHLVFAHARDLGMIRLNESQKLEAVQWNMAEGAGFVDVGDMVYLWNAVSGAKVHNAWFYGSSMLGPLIPSAKLIRTMTSDAFPAMLRATWSGLFLLVVKNEGNTEQSKAEEYEALTKRLRPGRPGVLIKDPEDVNSFDIRFDPKVREFLDLLESQIKLCISIFGLPQLGFYDEAAANMATARAKIELTESTNMEPARDPLGRAIADQWYQRWFELIYADRPELLKKFRIRLSWTPLHITEWFEKLEAVLELDGRARLKNSEFGELAGLDNYEGLIDPDAEVQPGGSRAGKSSVTETDEAGNRTRKTVRSRGGDAPPRRPAAP